ncbi:MAG TPA: hypothetical protein VMI54_22535 [Polyangiaceae bacterium]|nr:hypothetical protein [Polyangiaceae bacterium]
MAGAPELAADEPLNAWGRHGTTFAWLATALFAAPALRTGFVMDDFLQRLVLRGDLPELGLGPATLYDFTGGNFRPEEWLGRGFVPWFTDPALHIRFFRPLASLSIALDRVLFGPSALAAHLVGAALFAGVSAPAFALFRGVLAPNRAGLASFLFAVASGNSVNLTWVAGRHVLVGGLFGALAVLAVVRHAAGRAPVWLAPLSIAFAMLASETCLAALAMIVSYELCAREGPLRARVLRALPWAAAAAAYVVAYSLAGYGVKHSGLYISPLTAPGAFLAAAATRLPCLLGELAFAVPSSLWGVAARARGALAVLGVATSGLVVWLAWRGSAPGAERRKVTWFAFAVLLATLPMVGGVADGRMLLLPLFASAPLVASAVDGTRSLRFGKVRLPLRAAGAALLFMHVGVAGLFRLAGTELMVHVSRAQRELALHTDVSRCRPGSPLFVLTGADPTLSLFGGSLLRYYRPELVRLHPSLTVLSMAQARQRLARPTRDEVRLDVEGARRGVTIFETLFRDTPLVRGMKLDFTRFAVEVLGVADGLPTSIAVTLPEDACLLTLEHAAVVGRPLPDVGSSREVAYEPGPLGL